MRKLALRTASVLAGATIAVGVAAMAAPAANAATVAPQANQFGNCDLAHATPPTADGGHGPQTCYQIIIGAGPGSTAACVQLGQQLIAQGHIGFYECRPNLGAFPTLTLLGFGH